MFSQKASSFRESSLEVNFLMTIHLAIDWFQMQK